MNLQFYRHEAYRIAEERWHIHQRKNPHSVTDEDEQDFIEATVEMVLIEFIAEKENTILKIEEYILKQIDYFAVADGAEGEKNSVSKAFIQMQQEFFEKDKENENAKSA